MLISSTTFAGPLPEAIIRSQDRHDDSTPVKTQVYGIVHVGTEEYGVTEFEMPDKTKCIAISRFYNSVSLQCNFNQH
jgi:hypothetical protein